MQKKKSSQFKIFAQGKILWQRTTYREQTIVISLNQSKISTCNFIFFAVCALWKNVIENTEYKCRQNSEAKYHKNRKCIIKPKRLARHAK